LIHLWTNQKILYVKIDIVYRIIVPPTILSFFHYPRRLHVDLLRKCKHLCHVVYRFSIHLYIDDRLANKKFRILLSCHLQNFLNIFFSLSTIKYHNHAFSYFTTTLHIFYHLPKSKILNHKFHFIWIHLHNNFHQLLLVFLALLFCHQHNLLRIWLHLTSIPYQFHFIYH